MSAKVILSRSRECNGGDSSVNCCGEVDSTAFDRDVILRLEICTRLTFCRKYYTSSGSSMYVQLISAPTPTPANASGGPTVLQAWVSVFETVGDGTTYGMLSSVPGPERISTATFSGIEFPGAIPSAVSAATVTDAAVIITAPDPITHPGQTTRSFVARVTYNPDVQYFYGLDNITFYDGGRPQASNRLGSLQGSPVSNHVTTSNLVS